MVSGIRFRVDPPKGAPVLYGLESIAQIVHDDSSHWRTGVEYDAVECLDASVWDGWCAGTGVGQDFLEQATLSVDVAGTAGGTVPAAIDVVAASGGGDGMSAALSWSTTFQGSGPYGISVTVASQTDRQVRVRFQTDDGTCSLDEFVTASSAGTAVTGCDSESPLAGTLTVVDVFTGASGSWRIDQDVDGDVPVGTVAVAYPVTAAPAGCRSAGIVITGDDQGRILVSVSEVSDARFVAEAAGRRVEFGPGEPAVVADGLTTGCYRIRVRELLGGAHLTGTVCLVEGDVVTVEVVFPLCAVKETQPPWTTLTADPFTVYSAVECSAVGFPDADRSARSALATGLWRAAERAWWDRLADRVRTLSQGPVSPAAALARLEDYLAKNYGGAGVIHLSPWGHPFLMEPYLVARDRVAGDGPIWRGPAVRPGLGRIDDFRLFTRRGTPVVVGAGYSRDLGAQAEGDGFWMAATGAVQVRLAPVEVHEVFDRRTNVKSAVAERTVLVFDDCVEPAAVEVAVPGGDTGE